RGARPVLRVAAASACRRRRRAAGRGRDALPGASRIRRDPRPIYRRRRYAGAGRSDDAQSSRGRSVTSGRAVKAGLGLRPSPRSQAKDAARCLLPLARKEPSPGRRPRTVRRCTYYYVAENGGPINDLHLQPLTLPAPAQVNLPPAMGAEPASQTPPTLRCDLTALAPRRRQLFP